MKSPVSLPAPLQALLPQVELAVILGSGLQLAGATVLASHPYQELTGLPVTRVSGHRGRLELLQLPSQQSLILTFAGRFHLYEGHPPEAVTAIVELIAALGLRRLLITNAAGGIAWSLRPGELLLIDQILNLQCPAASQPDLLTNLTSPPLKIDNELSRALASSTSLPVGCYAAVRGPNYESAAEIELLRQLGAAAVGMSTYLEAARAQSLGLSVAVVSAITNSWAATDDQDRPAHTDVLKVARQCSKQLTALVRELTQAEATER